MPQPKEEVILNPSEVEVVPEEFTILDPASVEIDVETELKRLEEFDSRTQREPSPSVDLLLRDLSRAPSDVFNAVTSETGLATAGSLAGEGVGLAGGAALTRSPAGAQALRGAGGVLGAALGGFGGSLSEQVRGGQSPSLGLALEAAQRQAKAQLIGEATFGLGKHAVGKSFVGPMVERALNRMVPFRSTVTPEGRISAEFFQKEMFPDRNPLSAPGPGLPEITKSKVLDWLGNFTEGSPVTSQLVDNRAMLAKRAQEVGMQRARELGSFLGPDELGVALKEIVRENFPIAKATALSLKGEVLERAQRMGVAVDVRRLRRMAFPTTKDQLEASAVLTRDRESPLAVALQQPEIGVSHAVSFRDQLRAIGEELGDHPDAAVIGQLEKAFTQEIKAAMEGAERGFYGQLVAAEAQVEALPYLKMLVASGKVNPRAMVDQLFKDKDQVFVMRTLMSALEGEPEQGMLRRYVMERILTDQAAKDGVLQGEKLATLARELGGVPSLRGVFSREDAAFLLRAGEALKVAQAKQAEGSGKVVSQLMSAGALATVGAGAGAMATGDVSGALGGGMAGAGAVLLGPPVFAHIFTSPKARQLFLRGIKLADDTPVKRQIFARLTALLSAMEEIENSAVMGEEPPPRITVEVPSTTDFLPGIPTRK